MFSKKNLQLYIIFSIILTSISKHPFLQKNPKNVNLNKKKKNPKITNKSTSSNFFGGPNMKIDPNAPRNTTDSDDPFDDYTDPKYEKMDSVFNTDECLVGKDEAIKILKEKYDISFSGIPDVNLRFILGKCNPILFLPGIYATRLMLTINCKKFKENSFYQFLNMRLFCGENMCPNEDSEYEEYVLFPALFDTPFTVREDLANNKYSACFGYFMKFFNKKNECPDDVCYYNDAVRVSYFGGTTNTVSDAKCGLKAVQNVLYTGKWLPEALVNSMSGSAGVFYTMIKRYHKMGYREGFSYGAIPTDYRRFISTNTFVTKAFEYQINQLYENTGKKVVILAHSFGTIATLNQLITINPDLRNKIKTFVAMAPPFSGASKLLDVFLYGSHDFDTTINVVGYDVLKVALDPFGQSIAYNTIPTLIELRPLPAIAKLVNKEEYKDFIKALNELIEEEKICGDTNCDQKKIDELTPTYRKIFGDILPILSEESCQIKKEDIGDDGDEDINNMHTWHKPCRTEVYNSLLCPLMLLKDTLNDFDNIDSLSLKLMCGVYNSSLLYDNICDNNYYSITKFLKFLLSENKMRCLNDIYAQAVYPFSNPKLNELLDTYNRIYSKKYNVKLTQDDFEDITSFRSRTTKLIEYHNKISNTQNLPIPPINTYILYSNFMPTSTAFIYDTTNINNSFDNDEILYRGGDGTVPNWSSFLTGLKWLYDKKMNNLPQNISLVEYCSPLSKEGGKYAYDSKSKNNHRGFFGIGCDCINSDFSGYDKEKINGGYCQHATLISDSVTVKFVENEVLINDENLNFSDDVKYAVENYNDRENYDQRCNLALKDIIDNDI